MICWHRVMDQLHTECHTGLEKYEVLSDVMANNYTLFYEVLIDNLVELAPIVYAAQLYLAISDSRLYFACKLSSVPAVTCKVI